MASTFTPNIQWEEPARGDDVGTWDTPVNNNGTLIDLVTAAITTIGLNNSNVVLSAAQFRSATLTFNSTLTGNVTITFPTSFTKPYKVRNLCTGSSAFTITLATTATGGQVIGCPPGQPFECVNDGTNLYFHNFGPPVGGYWDYAGSSNPAWNTVCTVPPYLNCDGSAIPAAYTVLPIILGSSLLPNSKGKSRFALDQGAGLISSAVFSGTGVGATGGAQTTTLGTSNLPPYTPAGSIAFGTFGTAYNNAGGSATGGGGVPTGTVLGAITAVFTGNAQGGTSTPFSNVPPAYIGGLTLIRSA
jgi:hypothetical protein